jgi:hypothetical protein
MQGESKELPYGILSIKIEDRSDSAVNVSIGCSDGKVRFITIPEDALGPDSLKSFELKIVADYFAEDDEDMERSCLMHATSKKVRER